jgi:hypothetical protein
MLGQNPVSQKADDRQHRIKSHEARSHRQPTAARSTKLAQIRAMRERGLDEV